MWDLKMEKAAGLFAVLPPFLAVDGVFSILISSRRRNL